MFQCLAVLIILILGKSTGMAQQIDGKETKNNRLETQLDGIEINGLVVDETITKVGRDFYELFYQYWEAPPSSISYSVFVREQPLNGLGSKITVHVNDTEVFSQALQPRYDVVEAASRYAVRLVQNYIANYETLLQQLGNEDQQGTGVY